MDPFLLLSLPSCTSARMLACTAKAGETKYDIYIILDAVGLIGLVVCLVLICLVLWMWNKEGNDNG